MCADNFKFVAASEKTLSASITSTDTTITLTDLNSRDGTALAMTDFGDIGFATIEPNGSNMELISFTGITSTSLTGVTRGLKFEADYTQDTALRKAHAAGATVVFSNSPQFYNEIGGKDNDETITGTWTFTSTATPRYDTHPTFSADEELIDKKYADDLAIAGAPDSSTTVKGIVETATSAETQAGTDTGGTSANLFALPSDIAANVQNAQHSFAADAEASDTYAITLTPAISAYATGQLFYFTANTVNTGAATLNVNAKGAKTIKKNFNEDLEDGDIAAGAVVVVMYDGTNFQMLNQQSSMPTTALLEESATFFGATDITGAQAETLTDGSDASQLHKHEIAVKLETRNMTTATGTETVAHGLGVTPRLVTITGMGVGAGNGGYYSKGSYDGTTNQCIYEADDGTNATSGSSSSYALVLVHDYSGSDKQECSLTVDATNVTLSWTKTGTPTGTAQIIMEIYA